MIIIRGRLLSYGELWFDEEPPVDGGVDVLQFRIRPTPVDGASCSRFLSLVNDLTQDEQTIMAAFGTTNRYQINRAANKDALAYEVIREPREALDEFCAFFDEFALQKGIERSYRRGLEAACDAHQLVLSAARREGQRLVWHAHIVCRHTAALLHSASHFRTQDGAQRALVGRANRWLHWRDMLAFKEMGLKTYDWGGMFEDESVPGQASVNEFKRQFGGRPHSAYSCTRALTIKARALGIARALLERTRRGVR